MVSRDLGGRALQQPCRLVVEVEKENSGCALEIKTDATSEELRMWKGREESI